MPYISDTAGVVVVAPTVAVYAPGAGIEAGSSGSSGHQRSPRTDALHRRGGVHPVPLQRRLRGVGQARPSSRPSA